MNCGLSRLKGTLDRHIYVMRNGAIYNEFLSFFGHGYRKRYAVPAALLGLRPQYAPHFICTIL